MEDVCAYGLYWWQSYGVEEFVLVGDEEECRLVEQLCIFRTHVAGNSGLKKPVVVCL